MRSLSRLKPFPVPLVPGLRFERRFPTWKGGVLPLEPGPAASNPLALSMRERVSYEARNIAILRNLLNLVASLAILVYLCGYVGRSAVISPSVEPMSLMSGMLKRLRSF